MKEFFKKYVKNSILIIIFSIFFIGNLMKISTAENEQDVVISLIPKPKIDIALAKARTQTDVTTFETDIMSALTNLNIDSSDVRVTAVQAETVNMESSFSWQTDVSSSIGSIAITNGGQNVVMYGNTANPGKNAIWIMPDGNQDQKFSFGYNIDFGDSFNAAGMLLRVKQSGNVLTGYMLSFNNSTWKTAAANKNGAIWKFTYTIGQNSTNMTKTLVQSLDIAVSGTLSVVATDSKIVIEGGGLASSVTYNIPENDQTIGNGFGFFSDHYSHGCSNIGAFRLTNINLETTVVKSFNEILRAPEWRNDSYKYLVNVDDNENEELKDSSANSEILTRLLNENIHFISWGKEKNKVQFEDLITSNNGNGTFITNSTYANSINQTAEYIKSIVQNLQNVQTVIVNEPITISVSPQGIDKNTIDGDWPYGKWKIDHDYTYYENNIGQFAESGKYISDLITTFNKTGKYVIKYKDKDIFPSEIYVHRRPIAQIAMQVSGTTVTLNSESYDMDKLSDNRGILEEEWLWKASDSNTWNQGKLTAIDTLKTYVIQLRVKDFQNTWSIPTTKYITTASSALPVAMYNVMNNSITKYDTLEINDVSYDPAGRQITSRLWEVYKNGTKIYSASTPKTNYLQNGLGTYTMYLTVTNSQNIVSERFARTFEIVEDTMAPEVVANPTSAEWTRSVSVNVQFSDEGGSLFRGYKYAITDNQAIPTSWSTEISKSQDTIVIDSEGEKYLHIIGFDNANNVSEDRILGPYKIDKTGPNITVNADLNTITTEGVIVDINAQDLLSGVSKVYVNGTLLNGVETNSIRIYKNGNYLIEVEDNIGNISTRNIEVSNAYNVCDAGLEHDIYSSSLEKCPVCELIEGLHIINEEVIYDAQLRNVEYDNLKNATIIEYYNDNTFNPIYVGEYNYELKVVYNNIQYNTGITGVFNIKQKEITIQNINAKNRQYDSTNVVELEEGELVGIEAGDEVGFILSQTGRIDNINVGEYNVDIEDIVLSGDKSGNYFLKQPEEDAIKVNIFKRVLTIDELETVSRQYNKKAEVEIIGGKLNNLIEGNEDNIGFVLNGGILRDINEGQQIVDINTIELTNNEKENYILEQPGTLNAIIKEKEITIKDIKAKDRQYDSTNIVDIEGGELVGIEEGDEVDFILSLIGEISNIDVGEYNVDIEDIVLLGEKSENYILKQPEEDAIKVNILKRVLTIDQLEAVSRQYNRKEEVEIIQGNLNNLIEGNEDNIGFVLNGGILRDINVGEKIVDINTIELTNNEKENYILEQPGTLNVIITEKEITIKDIKAKDRQYDGTNVVDIEGGELVGIEEEDEIQFILNSVGTIENKNIGEYNVVIEEIILSGDEAENYNLKQPEEDEIKVNILRRELTITDLIGKERKFDKTDIVEIEGGILQNIVEEEDVSAIIPLTGVAENNDIGTWSVHIELIEIEGEDSENYVLIQPGSEEIKVTIIKPESPNMHVETFINTINGKEIKDVEPIVKIMSKKKEQTNDLESEELKENETDNSQKIKMLTESSVQRVAEQSEENKEQSLLEEIEESGLYVEYTIPENPNEIRYSDIIQVNIRIYNEGSGAGYVDKITQKIPNGMEFLENNAINKQNGWIKTKDNSIVTEKLSYEKGVENEIAALDTEKIDYRDISLVLKVIQKEPSNDIVKNLIILEQSDIRKEIIKVEDVAQLPQIAIKVNYTDLIVDKNIQQVTEIVDEEVKEHYINTTNNKLAKIEVDSKKINTTNLKIKYKISVTNNGDTKGIIDNVVEYIPLGLQYNQEENSDWKQISENTLISDSFGEIQPNQTITKELILNWDVSKIIGAKENTALILSDQDIDQRIIQDEIKKKITIENINQKIFKTNNVSNATMLVSIKTGINQKIVALGILIISTVLIIIVGIKIKKSLAFSDKE